MALDEVVDPGFQRFHAAMFKNHQHKCGYCHYFPETQEGQCVLYKENTGKRCMVHNVADVMQAQVCRLAPVFFQVVSTVQYGGYRRKIGKKDKTGGESVEP